MFKLKIKLILTQGDSDYAGVAKRVSKKGLIGTQLQADIDRLQEESTPVDIIFE